jgi:hypothetical protein
MAAYELLAAPPLDMALPGDIVVDVYVVPPEDLAKESPWYDVSNRRIFLPSTTRLPSRAEELRWMATVSRHEVAHAVSHLRLDAKFVTWHWLCEAFAVWVETLFPGDYFMSDAGLWVEYPETSLRECSYEAFPFVTFFADRLGQSAFAELWKTSHYGRDAWEAILDIVSRHGEDPESFFADYCLNSYVPDNYNNVMRAVYDRFGHRHAEECQSVVKAKVDSLACRYYWVPAVNGKRAVCIAGDGTEWNQLQVSAAQVLAGPCRGEYRRGGKSTKVDLELEVGNSSHIVIAISNDGAERSGFSLRVELQ